MPTMGKKEEFSFKNYFIPFTTVKAVHFIIIIGVIVFFNGLFNGFIGDDQPQIVNNPLVQSPANIPLFFSGSTFYNGSANLAGVYYKPLLTTFFSLTYALFGANAFGFHLFQIILYIVNACFLFLVLKQFFNKSVAFFITLIFLVHPINSETAFYISNTQEVLFFFFGILTLFILQRYHSQKALVSSSLLVFASMLSKETGILFLFITVVYVFFFQKKYVIRYLIYSALFVFVYVILRISSLGLFENIKAYTPIDKLSLVDRLLNVPAIFLFYLKTFFYPSDLSISWRWAYTQFNFTTFYLPLIIDAFFLVFLFSIALFLKKYKQKSFKIYAFFLTWFLFGMLLHIQIIPLDATVAERWFYFPIVGFLGMIGVMVEIMRFHNKNKIFAIVISVLLILFSFRVVMRSFDFRNEYTIDSHDITVSKNDYNLENNLSVVYFNEKNFVPAKKYAKESIMSFPNPVNYTSLGAIDFQTGDYKNAKKAFLNALTFGDYYPAYANLTGLLLFYGNPKDNILFIKNALEKYPQDGMMWMYLAILEYQDGNKDSAKNDITQAVNYIRTPLVVYIYNTIMNNKPLHLKYSKGQIQTS